MSSMESPRHEAAEATCLWLRHDHESCIQTLQRLELDPALCDCPLKVLHNLAVVEHYSSKRQDSKRLLEQLTHLLNDAASKAAEHPAPAAPTPRSHHALPANQPEQALMVPMDEGVANLKVNKALLLYREQQYDKAAQLLASILQQVEGLDEGTALHALLLQLDMCLHQHNLPQAASLLLTLEKACPGLAAGFAMSASPSTDEEQQQQQQQVGHAAPYPSSPSATARAAAAAAAKAPPSPATPQPAPSSSSAVAAFGAEPLAGASDFPHALPFISKWGSGAMRGARALLEQRGQPTLAPPNLALLVHMYRIRLALLQHNTRAARRELRAMLACEAAQASSGSPSPLVAGAGTPACPSLAADATAGGPDAPAASGQGAGPGLSGVGGQGGAGGGGFSTLSMSRTTALCRAHVDVLRGSCRKAAHVLTSLLQEGYSLPCSATPAAANHSPLPQTAVPERTAAAAAMQPVLLNDLGVVHHYSGRPELSAVYFQQAQAALGSSSSNGGDSSSYCAPAADLTAGSISGGVSREPQTSTTTPLQQQQLSGDAPDPPSGIECASYDSWAVTYNLGLQRLVLAQHEAALRCFERCLAASGASSGLAVHRPLLLLRAAQAALGLSAQVQQHRKGSGQAQAPLSQALLWLQAAHEAMEAQEQQRHDAAAAAVAAASATAGAGLGSDYGHDSHADLLTLSLPTDSGLLLQEQGRAFVQQSILSHLAYVHLQLGDQDAALAAATQLLGMPDLAPAEAEAAACYAAEVLVARGREGEAVALLASAHQTAAAALAAATAAAVAARARSVVLSGDGSQQELQVASQQRHPGGESPDAVMARGGMSEVPAAASPGPGVGLGVGVGALPSVGTLATSPIDECALRGARACHAALCTNLSAALLSQSPASATYPGTSTLPPEGYATGTAHPTPPSSYSLASEALEQEPGCVPAALMATYLDMMSGRCDEALQRIKAMQAAQQA